jgi:hypothetical protein
MRAVAGPDDAGGKKCDESEMLEVNLTVEIRLTGRPREAERAPEVGPGGCGATACGNGLRQLRCDAPNRGGVEEKISGRVVRRQLRRLTRR